MSNIILTEGSDPMKNAIIGLARHGSDAVPDPDFDPAAALYHLIVKGISAYIEAWADADLSDGPAGMVLDAEDLDDPMRALDPLTAKRATLLDMFLNDMEDYVCGDLGIPISDEPRPSIRLQDEDDS